MRLNKYFRDLQKVIGRERDESGVDLEPLINLAALNECIHCKNN